MAGLGVIAAQSLGTELQGWKTQVAAVVAALLGALLLTAIEMVLLRFRLRRELTKRFPGESLQGTTYYALMRAMQMRFMRLPKPQVKIGQKLPEHYH